MTPKFDDIEVDIVGTIEAIQKLAQPNADVVASHFQGEYDRITKSNHPHATVVGMLDQLYDDLQDVYAGMSENLKPQPESHSPTGSLLRELYTFVRAEEDEQNAKVTTGTAASVYHRDYLRTKTKSYRKYKKKKE